MLICARAVPDGETNQFIGTVLSVPVGQEAHGLDLVDDGDPVGIADWVASRSRPPQLRTREGEEVVQCELVVETDDGGDCPGPGNGLRGCPTCAGSVASMTTWRWATSRSRSPISSNDGGAPNPCPRSVA